MGEPLPTVRGRNANGVFEATGCLCLKRDRKGWQGVNCAEIDLAETAEGWRAAVGMCFFTGSHWGSWSPISTHDPAFPTRVEAIAHGVMLLRLKLLGPGIEPVMEPERARMLAWLDSLAPDQFSLFEMAA